MRKGAKRAQVLWKDTGGREGMIFLFASFSSQGGNDGSRRECLKIFGG